MAAVEMALKSDIVQALGCIMAAEAAQGGRCKRRGKGGGGANEV